MLTGNPKEAVPSYDLLDVNTVKSMLAFGLAQHQPCPWPHWLLTVLRNIPPRGANNHQIHLHNQNTKRYNIRQLSIVELLLVTSAVVADSVA